jgi:hypothetical protein
MLIAIVEFKNMDFNYIMEISQAPWNIHYCFRFKIKSLHCLVIVFELICNIFDGNVIAAGGDLERTKLRIGGQRTERRCTKNTMFITWISLLAKQHISQRLSVLLLPKLR